MLVLKDREGNILDSGTNTGPSNGYASTVRFSSPGSAYNDVVVYQGSLPIAEIQNGSMRREGPEFLWKPSSESDGNLVILTGSAPDPKEQGNDMNNNYGQPPQNGQLLPGQTLPQGLGAQGPTQPGFGVQLPINNDPQMAGAAIDQLQKPQPPQFGQPPQPQMPNRAFGVVDGYKALTNKY